MNWNEALAAGADIVVAGSAAIAAWFAAAGLNAWRRELKGRRTYELAEGVLISMYEAREVFKWMRSPASSSADYSDFERLAGEAERDFHLRAHYSLVAIRYARHVSLFGRLRSSVTRVQLHFGDAHASPIRDLLGAVDEAIHRGEHALTLSRRLMDIEERAAKSARPALDKVAERLERKLNEADEKYQSTDDELTRKVDTAVREAERLFKPILA